MTTVAGLIQFIILNGHLYLSGVWYSVYLNTDIKKTCVKKKIVQNLLNILGSKIDVLVKR